MVRVEARDMDWRELKQRLGKKMSSKLESQWGDLETFREIGTTRDGKLSVLGLRLGNIFLAVQPPLGLEGDPMVRNLSSTYWP